jgi:endonuclease-3
MTYVVSKKLFERARTPQEIVEIPTYELEELIRTIGFYRKKAATLKAVSTALIDRFESVVPRTTSELLSLPGVGLKTANLVLSVGFDEPAICVDVHVHRIANRLGLVATNTPEQTEAALKALVPREEWSILNDLFVMWGQNICTPVSPRCSRCPLAPLCPKIGVKTAR